jgi:hypothetical protein
MSNNSKIIKFSGILFSIPLFIIGIIQFFNHQYIASFFFIVAGSSITPLIRPILSKLPSKNLKSLRSILCCLFIFLGSVVSLSFDSEAYQSKIEHTKRLDQLRDSIESILKDKNTTICDVINSIDNGHSKEITTIDTNLLSKILQFKNECKEKAYLEIKRQNIEKQKSLLKRRDAFESKCLSDCVVKLMEVAENSVDIPTSFDLKSKEFRLFKNHSVVTIHFENKNVYGTTISNSLSAKVTQDNCKIIEIL